MKLQRVVLIVPSLLLLWPVPALAQHEVHPAWTAVEESPGTFRLDKNALAGVLAAAPLELTDAAREVEVVVSLPRPDGTLGRFRVEESPILSPAMTAKYGIRTYIARGLDEPGAIGRFRLGPDGFNAFVLAPSGSVVIRRDANDQESYLTVPYDDDPLKEATRCVAEDAGLPRAQASSAATSPMNTQGTVSIYYLAASATGEFTAQNGGTVASASTAITDVINGVNTIYRRDFGIHLAFVDDNDQLIQTSPSAFLPTQDLDCEGPTSCLQVDCLQTGNQCLVNGLIGFPNYDVSIVFDATNASGGASGKAELSSVCTSSKARGATGGTSIRLAAHEIGHMFGGHHTFNSNTGGSCANAGQRDAAFAFEPGSGSTIMSYAGTCGATDLQKFRSPDFHADNVIDVLSFIQTGAGSTCAGYGQSGNYGPIIQWSPGTRVVPASTPFILEVDAYDPNSDPVTYSFDESDTGTVSPPEGDDGSRPIYRVYSPSITSWRSFPSYQYVLNNANVPPATVSCDFPVQTCLSGETLHSTSRTMQFSLILRDGVDAVTITGATVVVDGTSGPFAVTSPNDTTAWTQGTQKVVFWNVAGTANAAGVNCQNVKISLSLDDGSTWSYVLAASTPNDGSHLVTLPFATSAGARIKVEAVGNIFYDVSQRFIIETLRLSNLNDSGRGSLRQAILDANDYPTGATIPVQLPGSGVRTISVFSQLPAITKSFALDGWELGGPDYTGPPLLEIAGGSCPEVTPGVPCDGLTILGNNSFINGIAVRNFGGNGIVMRGPGAYANYVQNSYIGTDATGVFSAGNGKSGVLIDGGYGQPLYGNLLWGNVISGNQIGVTINGAPANGNAVMRNKIGLNAAGTARIPNLDDGVRILGAPNTKVGQPGDGNVIAGNGTVSNGFVNRYADGIDVSGSTATGTVIQGNIIGLDATGTTGIYNTAGEINVSGAPNTLIGGTVAGARNVVGDDGSVNYNAAHCIYVGGAGATGTVIQGNYLGTDTTGTLNRGCRGAGIFVDGPTGVQIGGTTAAARNVISGNRNYAGVYVTNTSTGAMIQGNYIGTNVSGTAAIPNAHIGVQLYTNGNTVGGTAAGAGNVISGNGQRGIDIYQCNNNVVQGNFIGTNAAGTAGVGNGTYGINLTRAQNNQIGGIQPGARNIISGNGDRGIFVSGGDTPMAPGTVIQGNYIGTDVTGSVGISNATGIDLYFVRDATVSGNVISASRAGSGVNISSFGTTTSGIVIQGNKIGTNAAGTAPLGNTGEGIGASITGTASILGNVVAASGLNGISIGQGSFTIQGNWIGTDVTGTLDLRNTWSGIYTASPSPCLIGGTGPGEGNVIAFSSPSNTGTNHAGVLVGGNASGQQIRGNRIYSNTGLGIDLLPFGGVGAPDACDPDSGPNGSQNFPVLTAANQSGSSTHVTGTLNSNASTTFTIDFYASPSCDALGYGEGASYLGSATVPTNGSCNGSFDVFVPTPSSGVVTATATSPAGGTSEFSACRTVAPSPVAEVGGVVWAGKTELTWAAAAGATSYRVLRGDRQSLPDLLDVDFDSCTRYSGAALTTGSILTENPATAGVPFYWYLVVGANGTTDGPAGPATATLRIANPSGACP